MTTKFRIVYQDNSYTIQEGKSYLLGWIEIWRTKTKNSIQHPDMEFGVLNYFRPYQFKTMREAKKYLRKFQKGEKVIESLYKARIDIPIKSYLKQFTICFNSKSSDSQV